MWGLPKGPFTCLKELKWVLLKANVWFLLLLQARATSQLSRVELQQLGYLHACYMFPLLTGKADEVAFIHFPCFRASLLEL